MLFRSCAVKKNVIVASQLYDVADVQFTVEKEGSLEVLQFSQKYYLGNCSNYEENPQHYYYIWNSSQGYIFD